MKKTILSAALFSAALLFAAKDRAKKTPAVDPAAMPDGKATVVARLGFEEKSPFNVAEEPHTGKLCYKFPGKNKGGEIVLPLKNNTAYRISGMLRKNVCHYKKAFTFYGEIGNYAANGKDFRVCAVAGNKIYGDNKWNSFILVLQQCIVCITIRWAQTCQNSFRR